MLKLFGAIVVMSATFGMLFAWQKKERERITRLKELSAFLERTYYAMQTEQVQMIVQVKRYRSKDETLQNTLFGLAEMLTEHTYATGEQAWNAACEMEKKNWGFGQDAWELLLSCGTALFGMNLTENLNALSGRNRLLEKLIEEESCEFAEKRKVFTPIGLLGGVMLIVILL